MMMINDWEKSASKVVGMIGLGVIAFALLPIIIGAWIVRAVVDELDAWLCWTRGSDDK